MNRQVGPWWQLYRTAWQTFIEESRFDWPNSMDAAFEVAFFDAYPDPSECT
jgi:hypothetical protein